MLNHSWTHAPICIGRQEVYYFCPYNNPVTFTVWTELFSNCLSDNSTTDWRHVSELSEEWLHSVWVSERYWLTWRLHTVTATQVAAKNKCQKKATVSQKKRRPCSLFTVGTLTHVWLLFYKSPTTVSPLTSVWHIRAEGNLPYNLFQQWETTGQMTKAGIPLILTLVVFLLYHEQSQFSWW